MFDHNAGTHNRFRFAGILPTKEWINLANFSKILPRNFMKKDENMFDTSVRLLMTPKATMNQQEIKFLSYCCGSK